MRVLSCEFMRIIGEVCVLGVGGGDRCLLTAANAISLACANRENSRFLVVEHPTV